MEDYKITHVYNRPPEKEGWIKAAYIVQKENIYYVGEKSRREHKESFLKKLIEEEILIPLEKPVTKKENQTIWLTSEKEIYLANKFNPLGNEEKIFLQKIK